MGADPGSKLVGRSLELLRVEELLASARAGSVGAVAVLGEPGIGKTRLLGELCQRAVTAGFDVLTGRGSEFEQEVPFGLVVEALDKRFRMLEPELVVGLGQDRLAELAAVLPSLSGSSRQLASRLEVERFEFHRAVRATFERLVRRRPLLLALDDVQWADPASAELLSYVLRHMVPGMVLALAYRRRQAPRILVEAIEQATRESFLYKLELAPLTLPEAADLLGQRPESPIIRTLHAESGGNPFYLEQLARTVRQDRAAPAPGAASRNEHDIPGALSATIAQELAVLPIDSLRMLQAAAAAGDPFEVDLAAAIGDIDEAGALNCVDELVTEDLVRPTDVPGWFRFRHPIVRRVVYDGTLPGWRLVAHKRAAQALTQRGASLAVRAHHVERSATVGDEDAVAVLTEAGQSVVARAPAAAAGWFDAALRLIPGASGSERRLSLAIAQAGALASAGLLQDSRMALERALEMLPADSVGDRVRIIGMIAAAEHGMGRAEEAHHWIVTALGQAAEGSTDAVILRRELGENYLMRGEWERAFETAAHARAQAESLGDPDLLLAATASLTWYTSFRSDIVHGDTARAQNLLDLTAAGLDARGVDLTPTLLEALADLVYAENAADRFRAANGHAERGLHVSRATGNGHTFVRFTLGEGAAKLMLGQLNAARRASEAAVETSLLLDNDQLLCTAEGLRCWIETQRGDLSAAVAAGQTAVRAADRRPDSLFTWLAHTCYGEALIEAGAIERGRYEILSAGGHELSGVPPSTRPFWHQALVTAELSAGRIDAAEELVQYMEEATATGLRSRDAHALCARARLYAAKGKLEAAAEFAQQSAERFDAVEMRVWASRARLTAGSALARFGASTSAERELRLAHAIFSDAGAARLRDEAAKELRILGKRVQRKPTTDDQIDPLALTERERSIAGRVMQGYTNREIAAELFISPKTVEKHLARIFTKLGISTRAGVAEAMKRTGRDHPSRPY
ncbi:helix-turn-helix transcriptional regulator [Nocardia gipuzkoensis]|uniref:helix-turn-helix transcriptional regulator n=1 Tax=Nocardia gipuzkoensis TaxID=2749991 RepID=UPI00237EB831|nr:LuxR family transcriptional regulator [Nocardia gipuzkoensis]MDE1675380.1 AAA family ATPase [Nocardia gipuzkoensis]